VIPERFLKRCLCCKDALQCVLTAAPDQRLCCKEALQCVLTAAPD